MSTSEEDEFIFDTSPSPTSSPCHYHYPAILSLLDSDYSSSSHRFSLPWTLFQLPKLLLLILFILPSSNRLHWRLLSTLYSILMSLVSYTLNSDENVVWSSLFALVNVFHFVRLVVSRRRRLSDTEEQVYNKLFAPLRVSRGQFSRILSCKRNTRVINTGENYAEEKVTRVDSLSLLVSGRLLVSQQGRPLHVILPHQFVDSPEYFGVSTDELFQVTITALEETKILIWHRDKLRLTIMSDEFLRLIFDHVIGRDVVRKLIQVSDTVSVPLQPNGCYKSQAVKTQQEAVDESDPMLSDVATNASKDLQFCTTTLPFDTDVPRIKYFANEVWSLTKIDEEMSSV